MHGQIAGAPDAPTAGGRKQQNITLEEAREFLAPFFEQSASGGILVVGQIKTALDRRLGREVALASAYNLASTTITGENSPPTSAIHKAMRRRKKSGKKLSQTLNRIRQDWAQGKAVLAEAAWPAASGSADEAF